jgi:SAM-dependent methyltransferase
MTSRLADVAASFELRGRTRRCWEFVGEIDQLDVLNVGCSIGWFECLAVQHGARRAVGVDVSEAALSVARERVPGADFLKASALALPFPPSHFDVVTMFDVIEHLPSGSELAALTQARRVLRDGGRLLLSTPNRHPVSTFTDPAYYLGHRHYRRLELASLLRSARFEVVGVECGGRLFDQLDLLAYYASRQLLNRERHPLDFVRRRADREWASGSGWNTLFVAAAPATDRAAE